MVLIRVDGSAVAYEAVVFMRADGSAVDIPIKIQTHAHLFFYHIYALVS